MLDLDALHLILKQQVLRIGRNSLALKKWISSPKVSLTSDDNVFYERVFQTIDITNIINKCVGIEFLSLETAFRIWLYIY